MSSGVSTGSLIEMNRSRNIAGRSIDGSKKMPNIQPPWARLPTLPSNDHCQFSFIPRGTTGTIAGLDGVQRSFDSAETYPNFRVSYALGGPACPSPIKYNALIDIVRCIQGADLSVESVTPIACAQWFHSTSATSSVSRRMKGPIERVCLVIVAIRMMYARRIRKGATEMVVAPAMTATSVSIS